MIAPLLQFQKVGFAWLLSVFLGLSAAFSQPYLRANEAKAFYDIPANFKKQIETSVPKDPATKPVRKRKLLIYSQFLKERVHASVPYANYAFYQMGEQTGAFETFFSNDTAVFTKEFLDQFDAIMLNNTTGVLFNDPENRQYLLDYVYSGKGIIGIHAGAGATFVKYPVYNQFPEFGQMMGGYENGGHPWKTWEWINLRVDEPDHPVNIDFERDNFDISDEIYQYLNEYSKDRVRTLLSVNAELTDMQDRRMLPERRMDQDFPISWIKGYGRGRVFSSSLGHHPHINWDMRVLAHYFRGIQFALGNLKAPTTPNGKMTAETSAQEHTGLELGISAYSYKNQTLHDLIDHAVSMKVWNIGGLNVQNVSSEIPRNFDYQLTQKEQLSIRNKLLQTGVRLRTYYIHDIPNDEVICKKLFDFAKNMGIETIISEPKSEALELIDKYCNKYDIRLAIHNHGPRLSPQYFDPEKLKAAIEDRSNMIGACGDTGYWTRNGIDPIEAIGSLSDRLITVQLHDLHEQSSEGHDVPWGTGSSDVRSILETLALNTPNLTMIGLEYSYNWDKSDEEIKHSAKYFNEINIRIAADPNK